MPDQDDSAWCTIESDPAVFTELLTTIGVKNVQLEELYSLESSLLHQYPNVYGLIFLFKYQSNPSQHPSTRPGQLINPPPETLFFANQTIQNACATQALLSVVMNTPQLKVGDELENFRSFSTGMDSITKGMLIGNSDVIRNAHNSFAPQQHIVVDDKNVPMEKEDPFHFVAYIPHGQHVYELDGLQQAPRRHGGIADKNWLDVVAPIIQTKIDQYDGSEIRFNLMLVTEDPRERLMKQLEGMRGSLSDEHTAAITEIEMELQKRDEMHDKWKKENVRRRWNYMPFIVRLMKVLAEVGEADALIDAAKEKKRQAVDKQLEKESNEAKESKKAKETKE